MRNTICAALLLGAFCCLGETLAQTETDVESAALEAFVDGVVEAYRTADGVPGCTVAVVRPDRPVLVKGYGLADVDGGIPVDGERTRFHVASISKTFVWTGIMMLVERGQLDLDSAVNPYLKRYKIPDGDSPIKLNDLMAHRAGFEDGFALFSQKIGHLPMPEALAASEPAVVFPPGDRTAYSNWGANVAAFLIEEVTGRTYESFLFEEILHPLGMQGTALNSDSPAAKSLPVSKNYRVTPQGPREVPVWDFGSFSPIAGITTTAADMARWARFHLNRGELDGVRLLSEQTYQLMRTRAFGDAPGAAGMAHGFFDVPFRSTRVYGHSGSINDFLSFFVMAPDLDLALFISQNTASSRAAVDALPQLLFDRELRRAGMEDPAISPKSSEADVAAAQEVAGKYISNRRAFKGFEKFFSLGTGWQTLSAKDGMLVGTSPNAPFYRVAPDLWENRLGERLGVIRDSSGSITRITSSSGATTAERVTFWTNPNVLGGCAGAVLLFTLTTWLGLWRRFGHEFPTTRLGRALGALALAGALPLIAIVVAGVSGFSGDMAFSEVLADYPPPFITNILTTTTICAIFGGLLFLSIVPAWLASGWKVLRKIHYTLYGAAYGLLVLELVNWGLAFS